MKSLLFIVVIFIFSQGFAMERRTLQGEVPFERVSVKNSDIYFKKVKVAFFDADSTLRVSKSGSVSASSEDDVALLPCVAPRMAQLAKAGYVIAIVSNQGGIAAGAVTDEIAAGGLKTVVRLMKERHQESHVHYFDYAGYKNKFRKEKIGMAHFLAYKLQEKLKDDDPYFGGVIVDKKYSFMVGDSLFKSSDLKPNGKEGVQFSNSDRCFAENYYIRYFDPAQFFGWLSFNPAIDLFRPETGMGQLAGVPEAAKAGGAEEAFYCSGLDHYKAISTAIEGQWPTSRYIGDYQVKEGGEVLPPPLFERVGCKSLE